MTRIQDRLRERAAAREVSWPPDVEALLELGRTLDHETAAGEPADRALAAEVVAGLAHYVDLLPLAQRAAAARRLVAALAGPATAALEPSAAEVQ